MDIREWLEEGEKISNGGYKIVRPEYEYIDIVDNGPTVFDLIRFLKSKGHVINKEQPKA